MGPIKCTMGPIMSVSPASHAPWMGRTWTISKRKDATLLIKSTKPKKLPLWWFGNKWAGTGKNLTKRRRALQLPMSIWHTCVWLDKGLPTLIGLWNVVIAIPAQPTQLKPQHGHNPKLGGGEREKIKSNHTCGHSLTMVGDRLLRIIERAFSLTWVCLYYSWLVGWGGGHEEGSRKQRKRMDIWNQICWVSGNPTNMLYVLVFLFLCIW